MSMSLRLQALVAGVLVVVCALYAAWRLLPAQRRLRLIEWALPPRAARSRWVARWRSAALADAARGCGACAASAAAKRHRAAR
jgi:hypothetical protein